MKSLPLEAPAPRLCQSQRELACLFALCEVGNAVIWRLIFRRPLLQQDARYCNKLSRSSR